MPSLALEDIVAGVRGGDRRAIGRLISLVENDDPAAARALQELHGDMENAHVIGVTGSPGTGKSSLVDRLIDHYRRTGQKVGVVAVDPSSPFTGGAILGDRIRMQSRTTDPGVFIRSMGTRGALGGLSSHTSDAVKVLDAAGYDVVLVETVGVGQAEVEVVRLADTVLLVLVPGLGDDVQAVKAGVMEIADVFVVNKSDLDGADRVQAEVEAAMSLGHPDEEAFWWPPIVRTSADRGTGIEALAQAVADHRAWSEAHGEWHARRRRRIREQVRALLAKAVLDFAFGRDGGLRPPYQEGLEEVRQGRITPQDLAARIVQDYKAA